MIPKMNIIAWSQIAPWAELRQIEQDLIISRALVSLFSDPVLKTELRFRGGTALNKLLFPKPLRYSEDIDLVRTTTGPIGPILDRIRAVLEPWLGPSSFAQSQVAPKMRFRTEAEDGAVPLRLKVEINTRETESFDPPQMIGLTVENPWFSGQADIATYSREEMLGTKMRALLQRDKGRDLLDLAHALAVFPNMNRARIVECLGFYLDKAAQSISRAEAEKRMLAKLVTPRFMTDIRPLLAVDAASQMTDVFVHKAFMDVFHGLVTLMPGEAWAKTPEKLEKLYSLSSDSN
ncbi:MAG: nucleotidyl transferase AbiEii/AbiGii toxin family protein [Alphaproteobacteria bacterium]|nr:nucleotidyl transferase AbiEii/AbiGii toxin family protein [Alphaproteobacteria bacterium]